jgi:hypothetical protein
VAYGATDGAHAPPVPINGGNHLTGAPKTPQLKNWILSYVSTVVGIPNRIGGPTYTLGLWCSQTQSGSALAFMNRMDVDSLWFRGVIDQGHSLPGPLAALLHPREDSHGEEFNQYTLIGSALWA